MRVLALDTTTRAGSVALVEDDRVVDERGGDGTRTHALRMPGEIVTLADANRWPLSAIDLYGVATGPGSFTGLRIGIATIQGLAFVHQRGVVGVSALEALAYAASGESREGDLIAAWMDAYRGDVFTALYRVQRAGLFSRDRFIELEHAAVGRAADVLARGRTLVGEAPMTCVGDGAMLCRAEIVGARPGSAILPPPMLAGAVGRLAVERAGEALEPSAVRPFYVRRPDVEVARDKSLLVAADSSEGG